MGECIVYQEAGQPVSIMIPCDCGLTVKEIGQKDVPSGVPFWIVPVSSIPEDRTFRDAWELDAQAMGTPDGIGGTYEPQPEASE